MLQSIDKARFMATSLSNLVNNLSEGIHKTKCKFKYDDKNFLKYVELNISIANDSLNTQTLNVI